MFIILCYLIIAFGELFISPIGLAMVSTLVPQRLNGAMMGIFLISIGFGGKLAGFLAQSAVNDSTNISLTTLETVYRNSFETYALFSIGIFILCILAIKPINKLIFGKNK
jgi:POT family proton-dependent oligopeptide transporter